MTHHSNMNFHRLRRGFVIFLAFCMLFGQFGFLPMSVEAAEGETIIYAIPEITSNPENELWHVVESNPVNMRLTATSFQVINLASTPAVNGQYITLGFHVAESGLYDVDLNSFGHIAGGIVDIYIDEVLVQSNFSFYAPAKSDASVKSLTSSMRLDKGMHTITFRAKESVRLPSNGKYYLYLYMEDLRLHAVEIFHELNEVNLQTIGAYLNPGDLVPLSVTGIMAGGSTADLSGAQIIYTSTNPSVLSVDTGDGTAAAVAHAPGRALIKAEVTLDGVTRESVLEFNIGVAEASLIYDFKQPVDSKLEDAGWELGERTVSAVQNQAYGFSATGNKIGDDLTIRLMVPADGYYEVQLNGGGYKTGADVTVKLDGVETGEYSFYRGYVSNGNGIKKMRTVYLSAGVHELLLTITGRYPLATGWIMMPSELRLVRKGGFPTLESLELQASKMELMVGQTSKLTLVGGMADGYSYQMLEAIPSSVTMDVYQPEVAGLSTDGILRALQPGVTVIHAQAALDGIQLSAQTELLVNVKQLTDVLVMVDQPQISAGMSALLTVQGFAYGEPVDLSDASIEFTSLSPDIASVDSTGTILGKRAGLAEMQAAVTLGPSTQTGSVTLEILPPYLTEFSVTMFRPNTFVGERRKLNLNGKMNNGEQADFTNADITITSSNPQAVAIMEDGSMEILTPGTSTVTATVRLGDVTKSGSVTVQAEELVNFKTRATYFTDQKVASARSNAESYDWAKSAKEAAVANADAYLANGPDYLWSMIPSNSLPRGIYVNKDLGSPITGKEIDKFGNYPYLGDSMNEPWKIVDPTSGYKFPTNDFGAYYRSGLDEQGFFDPERADRSLLVNTLYPEKGPNWGVDDGYGWIDENGNRYTFIAYYTHWFTWSGNGTALIPNAIRNLREAYLYTGDPKYAIHGLIMLDRIADVYPELDILKHSPVIYYNSHGGTNKGKAVGSIWETGLIKEFIYAVDAFYPALDDPAVADEVLSFLGSKADQYDLPLKRSVTGIKRNIEDGILRQVYPAVKDAQIRGNNGYHQSALALAAVVFDSLPETKEWLDFNFQAGGLYSGPWRITGGNILATLVDDVDRDGAGNEGAPNYNRDWTSTFDTVAIALDGYDKYPQADMYENVKFRKMFSSIYPLLLSEKYIPSIGDSFQTGNPGLYGLGKAQAIKAFERFGDPAFAQLAHFLNNNRVEGIHGDIFSDDPSQIAEDIQEVIDTYGPLDLKSDNMTGFGFAALRDGTGAKFNYGLSYLFPSLSVVSNSKEVRLFDYITTVQFEADQVGDYVAFEIDVPVDDTYEVSLKPYRATSYGQYDVAIDGVTIGSVDFFGALFEHETLVTLPLAAGTHTITFTVTGKQAASTGYKMGVSELALLNAGEQMRRDEEYTNTLRDMWMYYGRSDKHGHRDTLNLGMHAYGVDLLPDLGYPEFADGTSGHRHEWTNNTISHNTVMVDKSKQQSQWVAEPRLFDAGELVQVMEVEAPKVYPDTTELYKRTTAMIRVDDQESYAVDFFRVKGGSDHHFSFHAAGASVTTDGLVLTPQASGTYAGADVEFEERPAGDSAPGYGYMGPGFHYLKNVERAESPADSFSVDWKIDDTWDVLPDDQDVHLRMTMVDSGIDDVALADGIPPRNKPGNPASLRYMIAHREGTNLDSLFTSVIEPYRNGNRYIESIRSVPVTVDGAAAGSDVKAVEVELANGRTDYIVSSLRTDQDYVVDGKFTFRGEFGVYSERDGVQIYGYAAKGTVIGQIQADEPSYTGTVTDFTRDMSLTNTITLQMSELPEDPSSLTGRYLYVANDGVRNASYRIRGVERVEGNEITFNIGDITTIRSWKDVNDYSQGFVYDMAVGQSASIPLSVERFLPELRLLGQEDMWEGATQTLVPMLLYADERTEPAVGEVIFTSDRPEIAAIDAQGIVTAHQEGTAVLSVSANGQTAVIAVTVRKPVLEQLELEVATEMTAGERQMPAVYGYYSDGSRKQLTGAELSSEEHSIMMVEKDGELFAIREGTAEITAGYEGLSVQQTITVIKRSPPGLNE